MVALASRAWSATHCAAGTPDAVDRRGFGAEVQGVVAAEDSDSPSPAAVSAAFRLPVPVTAYAAVGGAWSNRAYRLDAGKRRYALKELRNPWADSRWQRWLAESWSFEQRAIAAGVAAPKSVPNPVDGSCFTWVSRRDPLLPLTAVRVHHWVQGDPVGPGPVEPELAQWAGQVAGQPAWSANPAAGPDDVSSAEYRYRQPLDRANRRRGVERSGVGPSAESGSTGGVANRGAGPDRRLPAGPGSDDPRRH